MAISWRTAIDLVLPRLCVRCRQEDTWLCNSCLGNIKIPRRLLCPFCETETVAGNVCPAHSSAALERSLYCGFYHDPILRSAIRTLKYHFTEELIEPLAKLAGRTAKNFRTLLPASGVVVPIPLGLRKKRERGFNQAEVIAEAVALATDLPLAPRALVRVHTRKPQARISHEDRRVNAADSIAVNQPEIIKNNNIILVDDVLTTGSTLEAAARPLKNAGATSVTAFVLARG